MTSGEANEIMSAMWECWELVRVAEGLDHLPKVSPNHGPAFARPPKGVVLHYTASTGTWKGPVRWLNLPDAGASTHYIVARGRHPAMNGFSVLNCFQALVIPLVPLDQIAWHATWANPGYFGIEIVNRGMVFHKPGSLAWEHRGKVVGKEESIVQVESGSVTEPAIGFEVYRGGQLSAVVELLKALKVLYPTITDDRILPHSAVQSRSGRGGRPKRDTGPLFPIHKIRRALTILQPTSFWDPMGTPPEEDGEDAYQGDWGRASEVFPSIPMADIPDEKWKSDTSWEGLRHRLHRMGFAVDGRDSNDPVARRAVWIFQKSMGLPEGADINPALTLRLQETFG